MSSGSAQRAYRAIPVPTAQDVARFEAKYQKAQGADCSPWIASKDKHGYGWFGFGRKVFAAHRVAWTIHYGSIPPGKDVLHNCPGGDNPSCVRHDHLFLGDQASNMADMASKKRNRRGVKHHRARLDDDKVRHVIQRLAHGHMVRSIARELGVGEATIADIKMGRTWLHVSR